MNEKEIAALKRIYNSGRGYLEELRDSIGNDLLSEFISVGFIVCGYSRTSRTWRISNLGRCYVRELRLA
jgi:hypothetical protein